MTDDQKQHTLNDIGEKVDVMHKMLTGNGDTKDSIATRLILLETSVSNCQANHKFNRKGIIGIWTALIAAVGAIIVGLINLFLE